MSDDLAARVAAAAEALEAEGIRPTIEKVRKRVQANANEVHRALQLWKEGKRAQQGQQALPAPLDLVIPTAMRVALDAIVGAHAQI